MRFLIPFLFILLASSHLPQSLETPLERCDYSKVTTHVEMISFLNDIVRIDSLLSLEIIGESVHGRQIPMIHRNPISDDKCIKVLLFCQQHGNEPSGKEAALALLKEIANSKDCSLFPNVDLYLIPSLNPDGNESAKRFNANDSDLNRNHLMLTEPEIVALHHIYNRIKPEVTLDVHEYSAYRRSFREAGYVRAVDEQFGAPTNLNVSNEIINYSFKFLFPFLEKYLNQKDITFSNYYKMDGPQDTVRASTTGITDGRQSFAILNSFSFILEGKNGMNFNEGLKRRTQGQLEAIKGFLEFVDLNATSIKSLVENEQKKIISLTDSVIVQMDYYCDGSKIALPMKLFPSDVDTIITMPFSSQVIKLKSIDRPAAYVLPQNYKEIIHLLDLHNIQYEILTESKNQLVEIYSVEDIESKWLENKPFTIISVTSRSQKLKLEKGDVIVPVSQIANNQLCIILEPESMWGIVQYEQFSDMIKKGKDYPIYRIKMN